MEDIRSEFIQVTRPDGKVIRGLVEVSAAADAPHTPVVLLVPPYAKTIRDMFFASLYLTLNGFRTIRYDNTNHIGASDGRIFDYTLSSALEDLTNVLPAVRGRYPEAPLGVFSTSLGARIAFRALAEHDGVSLLVSLVGVVHVQDTLRRVMGRDFVEELLEGRLTTEVWEVLGYDVGRQFIEDTVGAGWYSRESAGKEVAACLTPIMHISTEQDDWAHLPDVEAVFGNGSRAPRELFVIPGSSHHLEKNPSAARLALVQAVAGLQRYTNGGRAEADEVRCPNFVELVRKNKHERHMEKIGYRAG